MTWQSAKKKHDAATAWVWLSSGLGFDATVHLHVVSLSLPPVIGVFQPPCRTLPDGAHWHWYQSGPQKRAWLHDVSLLDLCDYIACISTLASINGTIVNLLDKTSVVSDQIVVKEHGGGNNRIGQQWSVGLICRLCKLWHVCYAMYQACMACMACILEAKETQSVCGSHTWLKPWNSRR